MSGNLILISWFLSARFSNNRIRRFNVDSSRTSPCKQEKICKM